MSNDEPAGTDDVGEAAVPVAKGEAELHFRHPGFAWLDQAECESLSQGEFFVDAGHVIGDDAKQACLRCLVWRDCTIFSYVGNPDGKLISGGYFAGLSLGQRRKMTLGEALEYGEQARRAAGIDVDSPADVA